MNNLFWKKIDFENEKNFIFSELMKRRHFSTIYIENTKTLVVIGGL